MKYSDIEIGQEAFFSRTITAEDIVLFSIISGDENCIHLREDKPVVYGALLISYISAIIGNQLPGDGALWTSLKINFISPCYVGDTIAIIAQVVKKTNNHIDLHIDGLKSNGQDLFLATANILNHE